MNSANIGKIPDIPTDRELRPTCSWCGTNESKNWLFILGRGKFYCSFDCRDAASYKGYVGACLACLVGLILLMITLVTVGDSEGGQFTVYFGSLLLIGLGGAIMLTRNSIDARRRIPKNSKHTIKS
jgi:hypothetical protein